jgi:hypothetical protein
MPACAVQLEPVKIKKPAFAGFFLAIRAYFLASASHFLIKDVFAAPANGLPFFPTAFSSQPGVFTWVLLASHFFMKDFFAAPARGLPSFPTAFASQPEAAGAAAALADAEAGL